MKILSISASVSAERSFVAYGPIYFESCLPCSGLRPGLHLPYDGVVLASEVVYLFVLSAVEAIRLRFAVAGNFLERPSSTLTAVALLFINVVGCVWVAIWQSYILYLELILAVGQLAFYLAEFICGFVAFGTFLRAQ
ncbi:hypothetical protein AAHC03_018929 [Spirometra sp. Aus1]|nr:unnamed protein product [Spirometra erinaceieuropaei]